MKIKKHYKIFIWQMLAFVIATALIISAKFLMPWFVDSYLLSLDSGIEHLIAQALPYSIALAFLLALPQRVGVRSANIKPEIKLISPILILFGVILVYSAQLVISPLASLIPSDFMADLTADLLSPLESGFWPMFTFIFIIPLLEEWLYRGVIQRTLTGMVGIWRGLILMALICGVAEIIPQSALVVMASSLVFGAIYFVKQSLTTVYMIHVLCNGFSYLLYLFFGSAGLVREQIATNENFYVIIWAVAAILLVVTGWWVSRHNDKLSHKRRIKKVRQQAEG